MRKQKKLTRLKVDLRGLAACLFGLAAIVSASAKLLAVILT